MRHQYKLTNESIKVLSGNVPAVAEEMNVSDKAIYAILANNETDPFARFSFLYAACVRAGLPVCHWDNKLAAIRTRYEKILPRKTEIECLTEKIRRDADTTAKLVEALRDGRIDDREAEQIQIAIQKERECLEVLETLIGLKRDVTELRRVS